MNNLYHNLIHGDEQKIEAEIKGLKKVNPNATTDITTRLKHMITSVEGKRDQKDIREFVDTYLLAKDAKALRDQYNKVSPDINMVFKPNRKIINSFPIVTSLTIKYYFMYLSE